MTAEFLRTLPKVQLHCHLEGTLRASSFIDIARRRGVALTYHPHGRDDASFADRRGAKSVDRSGYHFPDFQAFLLTFAAVSRSLAQPDDYFRLAREYAEDALAQNVVHAELFISPSVWQFFHPQIDVRQCMDAIDAGFAPARARDVEINLIADLTRNFGPQSALQTAKLAESLTDLGVIGVGLGGDEVRFPAELFEDVFAYARAQGLHCVAHAGEAAGPASVWAVIDVLKAERIGHGVRSIEDPLLVKTLAERRIPLEVCPASNFLTGAASRDRPPPLVGLDASGCIVTIDADDPPMFDTTLTKEYEYVAGLVGEAALVRFVGNAIDGSFAEVERKRRLHERLAASLEAQAGVERKEAAWLRDS